MEDNEHTDMEASDAATADENESLGDTAGETSDAGPEEDREDNADDTADANEDKEQEDDEEEDEEDDEEEEIEPLDASKDDIADALDHICQVGTGTNYAYVKLSLPNRDLTACTAASAFQYLRYVDVSGNKLTSLAPFGKLGDLLSLNARSNRLRMFDLESLPALQHLDISDNRLKELPELNFPEMTKLLVAQNRIKSLSSVNARSLPMLAILDASANRLRNLSWLDSPDLLVLKLRENRITKLNNIEQLSKLQGLEVDGNPLAKLAGIERCTNLIHLSASETEVADLDEIRRLSPLKSLTTLILQGAPVAEQPDYRVETLVSMLWLKVLDEEPFSEEERDEATELKQQQ